MHAATLGLLASLYFAQGLPYGFFTQALPVLMRERGFSLEAIGFSSLLFAPWALKFLWAPWVDRYGSERWGRRRSWIVPLMVANVAALVLLAANAPDGPIAPVVALVCLVNLLSATQDVATDALAVDAVTPEERGIANGLQVAGYRVGMIVGGGALLVSYGRLGWSGTFLAMAALLAVATAPIALGGEPPGSRSVRSATRLAGARFLGRPGARAMLALAATYKLGDAFGSAMLRPLLVDLGYDLADVGKLLGTAGFLAGLLGALVGGALVRPLGGARALLVFGGAEAVGMAGYAALAAGAVGGPAIAWLCTAEHFASGMATAALFTMMMDYCRPGRGATDYTAQASAQVLGSGLAGWASGLSAGAVGYPTHFAAAALLGLVGALAAPIFLARGITLGSPVPRPAGPRPSPTSEEPP